MVQKQTNNLVVKKNELIQKARYALSTQEQKLLLYAISKVKPDDTQLYEYDFDLGEMCRTLGITMNGKNYANIRAALQSIRDKSFWIHDGNVKKLCAWISGAEIFEKEARVRIQLDKRLMPYLLEIRESYTAYQLKNVLGMKSKYSIRLYEIFKSYANLGEYSVSVEDLQNALQVNGYSNYVDFRKRVLDVAIGEINSLTDITVTYTPIKTGRFITHFNFRIARKDLEGEHGISDNS